MIKITTHGMDGVSRALAGFEKQARFAAAKALTLTAKAIQAKEEHEIRDVFDRPTPYTQRSIFTRPATPARLEAYAGVKDDRAGSGTPATKYLASQIVGGSRNPKRFELALRSRGILPDGYRVVPGAAARLDAYGNISVGQIRQILSYFGSAEMTAGYYANMKAAGKARLLKGNKKKGVIGYSYFVSPRFGHLLFGVYQKLPFAKGSAIRPVMIFVPWANYEAIFDFGYVAENTARKVLPEAMRVALESALATARAV